MALPATIERLFGAGASVPVPPARQYELLRDRFAQGIGRARSTASSPERGGARVSPSLVEERFDQVAAFHYLSEPALKPFADQAERITRLTRARRRFVFGPGITREEPDPYHGQFTLQVLLNDEQGELQLVNNSYPKINEPPATEPIRPAAVNLCWVSSFGALEHASVLNALMALVMDDLREALQPLRAPIAVHRFGPTCASAEAGVAGKRLRDRLEAHPDGKLAATLFERVNAADAAIATISKIDAFELPTISLDSWFVLCLFDSTLRDIGLSLPDGDADDEWRVVDSERFEAHRAWLQGITDVVVVPPPDLTSGRAFSQSERSRVYRVLEGVHPKQDAVVLSSSGGYRSTASLDHFFEFRGRLLDLALDALATLGSAS
jgi:hypothetical protein